MGNQYMTAAEPKKLLHFEIIETLGSGGNGTVYRALDTAKNEVVALKTLKNVGEVTLTRFRREYLALKKMDNEGIVRVHEGFFEHEPPFFSMEWVRGKTLSNVIEDMENNPLVFNVRDRENFALRLAIQVCDILHYIHQFEEVHRDLKPDNIFVTLNKGNILDAFKVKMLDFGLLKQLNEKDEEEDTQGGMIVGTVHYLSPEQAKGTSLDPRSDLYSLGIIMYRIISLKLPHEAGDVVGYIFKTVFEDPTPIEQQLEGISSDIQSLMADLLAKDPSKRPPSATALKSRLAGLLQKATMPSLDIDASDLDFTSGLEGFGSPLLPPPLVGREKAIKVLEDMTDRLQSEGPLAVIIEGEPGMGRSSVVKEWKSRIQFKKPTILQVHFNEDAVPAQDPVGTLLDSLIRTMKPEEVKSVFREVYPFLSGVSRYLSRYFDTKSVGKFDHLSPSRKLQVLAVNFIKLLQNLSDRGPVIVILEDVNFAKDRFLGWLTLVWEQLGNRRALLLFSRNTDAPNKILDQFVHRISGNPNVEALKLKPLENAQILKLLQSMLPIGKELPFSDSLKKLLEERTGGNPFYSIELFSRLYEDEKLFINKGKLDIDISNEIDVPHSIHQALLKKVGRLDQNAATLLKVASVFGTSFDYQWLASALQWPDDRLQENLMQLFNLGLLSEEEVPVRKLNFNAPALQKVILEQLPERERFNYHHLAAKAIEANLKQDDVPALEQVAFHYANSSNYVRAVKYAYLAGNCALEAKDIDKAVYFYELSLEMMDKMENKQARNLVNLKLAEVHLANHNPREALRYYNASLQIPNLSKMEELRSLRGRMLCFVETDQLDEARRDATKLAALGSHCNPRIQAETRIANGRLAWTANADSHTYLREILAAGKIYSKAPKVDLHKTFALLLANKAPRAHLFLKQQLEQSSDRPYLLLIKALLSYFMGNFESAAKTVQELGNKENEQQLQIDPVPAILHALLTYKIRNTLAPDHSSDEYLTIAQRYVDRFGLTKLTPKIQLTQMEHLLLNARYQEAWVLVQEWADRSVPIPCELPDRQLFLCFVVRAAWEVGERPPRGWLIQFQKLAPAENDSFLLQTHWALARAAEALLPLSSTGPKTLKILKGVETILIEAKLKYYYRAVLAKQIAIYRSLDKEEHAEKLDNLRKKLDKKLNITLPPV